VSGPFGFARGFLRGFPRIAFRASGRASPARIFGCARLPRFSRHVVRAGRLRRSFRILFPWLLRPACGAREIVGNAIFARLHEPFSLFGCVM